jgi:putative flippase GtrA
MWGACGFVRVMALAANHWGPGSPFEGLDFLGWTGIAVWAALPVLVKRLLPSSTIDWLVASLSAAVEGGMCCGFAAVAWWTFNWDAGEAVRHPQRLAAKRYWTALIVSACLVGIANVVHSMRPVPCADCFWPHGIPFTFYHEGGFAGGEAFVWRGIIGDAIFVFLLSVILGWAWNFLSRKRYAEHRTSA